MQAWSDTVPSSRIDHAQCKQSSQRADEVHRGQFASENQGEGDVPATVRAFDARPSGARRAGRREPGPRAGEDATRAIALATMQRRSDVATVLALANDPDTRRMTTSQILMLAAEALAYDAVVVLWVSRYGTQPVLMPRSLGQAGRAETARSHGPARSRPFACPRRPTDSTAAPRTVDPSVAACHAVATARTSIGMPAGAPSCKHPLGASHNSRGEDTWASSPGSFSEPSPASSPT